MINPFFAALTLLGLALPILPTKTSLAERRLYWSGSLIATPSAFLTLYPPDWWAGLVLSSTMAAVTVMRAYMTTSYIRIRGRTYAFSVIDSHDEDTAYTGFATAAKMWWLFVIVIATCSAIIVMYVVSTDGAWYAAGAVMVALLLPIYAGHQDASWGQRVARGQLVQLIIGGILTLGIFAILYLAAFAAGSRWPIRSRRSPEYRRITAGEDSGG